MKGEDWSCGGGEMERERESSFQNCQSINHEKEPQGQNRQNTNPTNEILNYPTRSNVCMVQIHFHSEMAHSDAEQLSGRQHPKLKLEPRQCSRGADATTNA